MTAPTLTAYEALELIANTDPVDAALDPQRLREIAKAVLAEQPELPEPVAEITAVDEYGPCLGWHKHWVNYPVGTQLYTAIQLQQAVEQAQVKQEPMTEVEINRMCGGMGVSIKWEYLLNFASAIEAHHNIK